MGQGLFSKRDFESIQETAVYAQQVVSPTQLPALVKWVMQFVPSEYSACGHFSLVQNEVPGLAHSNYHHEFCQLYMTQGLVVDPAVVRLLSSSIGQTSSLDDPRIIEPRMVVGLKLDFGIKTCHSLAIRGGDGRSMYMAFSNFDRREHARLKVLMDILGPHIYLAYQRAHARQMMPARKAVSLTPRENEILKWVAAGKSNWEIAMICHVSLNTIKFHLSNILTKLGVENRWAAIAAWHEFTQMYRFPSNAAAEDSTTGSLPLEPSPLS